MNIFVLIIKKKTWANMNPNCTIFSTTWNYLNKFVLIAKQWYRQITKKKNAKNGYQMDATHHGLFFFQTTEGN